VYNIYTIMNKSRFGERSFERGKPDILSFFDLEYLHNSISYYSLDRA
jgi:hypothetical protein